jgi:hypothetical protein
MEVSGQIHALAVFYPQANDRHYPLERRLGRPQSWSGERIEEKSLASTGDRTLVVQFVVRLY